MDRANHPDPGPRHDALRSAPARDRRNFAKNVDPNTPQLGTRRPGAAHGASSRSAEGRVRVDATWPDIDRTAARSLPLVGETFARAASKPCPGKSKNRFTKSFCSRVTRFVDLTMHQS